MNNSEIRSDLYIRAAIDSAIGSNYVATKSDLPAGIVLTVREAIEAGAMPTHDGVTIGEMARGFLEHRLKKLFCK